MDDLGAFQNEVPLKVSKFPLPREIECHLFSNFYSGPWKDIRLINTHYNSLVLSEYRTEYLVETAYCKFKQLQNKHEKTWVRSTIKWLLFLEDKDNIDRKILIKFLEIHARLDVREAEKIIYQYISNSAKVAKKSLSMVKWCAEKDLINSERIAHTILEKRIRHKAYITLFFQRIKSSQKEEARRFLNLIEKNIENFKEDENYSDLQIEFISLKVLIAYHEAVGSVEKFTDPELADNAFEQMAVSLEKVGEWEKSLSLFLKIKNHPQAIYSILKAALRTVRKTPELAKVFFKKGEELMRESFPISSERLSRIRRLHFFFQLYTTSMRTKALLDSYPYRTDIFGFSIKDFILTLAECGRWYDAMKILKIFSAELKKETVDAICTHIAATAKPAPALSFIDMISNKTEKDKAIKKLAKRLLYIDTKSASDVIKHIQNKEINNCYQSLISQLDCLFGEQEKMYEEMDRIASIAHSSERYIALGKILKILIKKQGE